MFAWLGAICLLFLSADKVEGANDPCSPEAYEYIWMYEGRRSTHWRTPDVTTDVCDYQSSGTQDVWYRFDHQVGTRLIEECVDIYRCGTQSPIWMNGSHPTGNEIEYRQVCANYGVENGTCCDWTANISVKSCNDDDGEFFIYKLANPPGCALAYCVDGDSHKPCPPNYLWSEEFIVCYPNGSPPTRPPITDRPTTTPSVPAGTWGPWSDWSDCSKSCDNGLRTRSRTCWRLPCLGTPLEPELCARNLCEESKEEFYEGISVLFSAVDDSDDADHAMLKVVTKEDFLLKTWRDEINSECNENVSACCGTSTGYRPVKQLEFVTENDIWTADGHPRKFQEDDVEFKFVSRIDDEVDAFACGRRARRSVGSSVTYISAHILEKAVNGSAKKIQDVSGLVIIGFRVPTKNASSGSGPTVQVWEIVLICIGCGIAAVLITTLLVIFFRKPTAAPPSYESAVKQPQQGIEHSSYENDGRPLHLQIAPSYSTVPSSSAHVTTRANGLQAFGYNHGNGTLTPVSN